MNNDYKPLRESTIGTRLGVDLDISTFTIDVVFIPITILALTYGMVLVYGWDTVYQNDWSKIMIIVTNAWGIFPLIVARGAFLKLVILGTVITSFWAHMVWENFKVPGNEDSPGKWDNVFSTAVIVAYCIEWLPDRWFKKTWCCKDKETREKLPGWVKETFIDRPTHTNACNFRLDGKTILQLITTVGIGILIYFVYDTDEMYVSDEWTLIDIICLVFVGLAFVWGLIYIFSPHHIYEGDEGKLIGWIIGGALLGTLAIVSKKLDTDVPDAAHAVWHIAIFSSAYCISRAHSYLRILKD